MESPTEKAQGEGRVSEPPGIWLRKQNQPLILLLEDGNSPHGRASPAAYLERQTYKAETTVTD